MVMSGEGDEDAVRTAIDAARTWMQAWDDIGLCSRDYGVWSAWRVAPQVPRARVPHASETGAWHATRTNISKEYSDPYYDFFCSTNE